jgi:anti-sigma factor RsiW
MNQHVASWLGAYHDGELAGLRLRQVEAHLAQCETCRTELERIRALAALLQESPAATGLVPPDRFVAQVGLRLPRRPTQPAWQRALETGWRLVPLGLFGAWAFVQAVFAVAGVVMLALRLGVGGEALAGLLPPVKASWLAQVAQLSGASLSDVGRVILRMLGSGGPLGWGVTLNTMSLVVIGLLYWSWLASWWARHQHRQSRL